MSPIDRIIHFCLHNKLVVALLLIFICAWGIIVAPFDWNIQGLQRDPVPVDAIPDLGENQQIVFTQWMGRSPQDVEDQISYPLTVSLMGLPDVKTVRSYSFFGYSSIYVIFKESADFYDSRSRIIEKLSSMAPGTLPDGVKPSLGPDATALGQVFWYTLEGRDAKGEPAGGWNLDELRSIQDYNVRYSLLAADGVAEVASVGGFVKEYQIDVDPDALRAHGVSIEEVFGSVKMSNIDVGARSIELNGAEYVIRGLGFIHSLDDIRNTVIKSNDNVPITIGNIAQVSLGPALRRGALDKGGAEAVGGVVVVRYGENPLETIKNIKAKIEQISQALPKKTLEDGTVSQVTVVPFYDRSDLIRETLDTLSTAISEEVLVTIIVILLMVFHLRSAILISGLLPVAVLMTFIAMKTFDVAANIVALSGIAIAIGTIVDMGVVLCENILTHLSKADEKDNKLDVIFKACSEVGGAVLTAVATTVISFLPVFTMVAAEGKLFKPLAYTKTFALISSIVVALTMIPPLAYILFTFKIRVKKTWNQKFTEIVPVKIRTMLFYSPLVAAVVYATVKLNQHWMPLGPIKGEFQNLIFVLIIFGSLLGLFWLLAHTYVRLLAICLRYKTLFLCMPLLLVLWGAVIWLGFFRVFSFLPTTILETRIAENLAEDFPGLGKEFMPDLDEGSFLYMPTTMPHASIGEAMDAVRKIDMAIASIPEVETAVGKLGRAETPLDPAPISMIETIVNYKSEFRLNARGHRGNYRYNTETNAFERDKRGELIEDDEEGRPFRQWRDSIKSEDDIWDEMVRLAVIPGVTSAPKLQPIAARIVMLQSGMRAPMGVKVFGPNLESIDQAALEIEKWLKQAPLIEHNAVLADRMVGKPYLEIDIDRKAIARYGIKMQSVQSVIEMAVGGMSLTTSVEGRERYPIRVRYARELRDNIDGLKNILVPSPSGAQIPLQLLAELRYTRGPMVLKSEDTRLVGYVLFDKKADVAEVDAVEAADHFLKEKIKSGEMALPAGVDYKFSGSYENQIRSEAKLMLVLPLALFFIFLIIYFQFKSVTMTVLVFSGIFVAWSGGFQMIWLYSQDWFLNFDVFGTSMRTLFGVHPYNLSVAVWVGFLALFGIATDDGVIMLTYIKSSMENHKPDNLQSIRASVLEAAARRIRPCLMTSATTIIALLPVLSSNGRGSDVMIPMAIPSFGGMSVVLLTVFVVPTLYCWVAEMQWKLGAKV